jgi:hypothetical protein
MTSPRLSAEHRHALTLLHPARHRGGVAFLARRFNRVHGGLAMEQREVAVGSSRTLIEVVRIVITDAGRTGLES